MLSPNHRQTKKRTQTTQVGGKSLQLASCAEGQRTLHRVLSTGDEQRGLWEPQDWGAEPFPHQTYVCVALNSGLSLPITNMGCASISLVP